MTKRINKADLIRINQELNSVSCADMMLSKAETYKEKALWANHGYRAMLVLSEYGIERSAGEMEYWTRANNLYTNLQA